MLSQKFKEHLLEVFPPSEEKLLKKGRPIFFERVPVGAREYIASLYAAHLGLPIVWVMPKQKEGVVKNNLTFFSGNTVEVFPAWEALPGDLVDPGVEVMGERFGIVEKLCKGENFHIVGSLQAFLQHVPKKTSYEENLFLLETGKVLDRDFFVEKLVAAGYQKTALVLKPGEIAVRGCVVDCFPWRGKAPVRVEFWDDLVESLRLFNVDSQKSMEEKTHISIVLEKESRLLEKGEHTSLVDLVEEALFVFEEPVDLEEMGEVFSSQVPVNHPYFSSLKTLLEKVVPKYSLIFSSLSPEELDKAALTEKSTSRHALKGLALETSFSWADREMKALLKPHPFISMEEFIAGQNFDVLNKKIEWLCLDEREVEFLKHHFSQRDFSWSFGGFQGAFGLKDGSFALAGAHFLHQKERVDRQAHGRSYAAEVSLFDLSGGDIIVHEEHGFGRFEGIGTQKNHQGLEKEFLALEYAQGGKLYVPIEDMHKVTRYVGPQEGAFIDLHKLGSPLWKNQREKTERQAALYAKELMELYAKRIVTARQSVSHDSEVMQSFERAFPYEETEDQLAAMEAIKQDFYSQKIMDRLLCGDVGYGKTEVAMRAAFKMCIDGGKQVAVLVPTTLLAMQHYENFKERMEDFGVEVRVLSRFVRPKEVKKILQELAEGRVDIVIGTHRLLGKDISFANLGLLVIDEEHRFGVKAKEVLKRWKSEVDVLSLSATPIPRTLYMSLMGARDLSVMKTPPHERIPVRSVLVKKEDETLKKAILRELNRSGQIFFIHNRVETIEFTAAYLQKLVPGIRVGVAHGQMDEEEIDRVFHAFKEYRIDLLVATTIVENGIDMHRANTILIDRADRFGLSELYQLRGRVGRWNRQAYCYFLVENPSRLPELSKKRLEALLRHAGFGAGMSVAMEDLYLRGAGHIFGEEQSGHAHTVGYHLYCQMLKNQIDRLQGKLEEHVEVKIEIPFEARFSAEYIPESSLRMDLYRRLQEIFTIKDLENFWAEVIDRFGTLTPSTEWLKAVSYVKIWASMKKITLFKWEKMGLTLEKQGRRGKELYKKLFPPVKTPAKFLEAAEKALYEL